VVDDNLMLYRALLPFRDYRDRICAKSFDVGDGPFYDAIHAYY
jgi:hypothetical protein